jgi:hypothetical protein
MSFLASTLSRNSSWAWMMLATWSLMPVPRKMMRSIIKRLNTSIWATFSWRSSMMYGVIDEVMALLV